VNFFLPPFFVHPRLACPPLPYPDERGPARVVAQTLYDSSGSQFPFLRAHFQSDKLGLSFQSLAAFGFADFSSSVYISPFLFSEAARDWRLRNVFYLARELDPSV